MAETETCHLLEQHIEHIVQRQDEGLDSTKTRSLGLAADVKALGGPRRGAEGTVGGYNHLLVDQLSSDTIHFSDDGNMMHPQKFQAVT
ncbi:unnamed protein product [Hydatigera taeniaeformis]|uniref:Glutamine synthetase n=1 Tax=Hydatigena taeniaeformis TaxID=6205 RepID=A0A0R3WM51_HYDTA|nr:unnamed protein product [Hydatigera taeniaeformis]